MQLLLLLGATDRITSVDPSIHLPWPLTHFRVSISICGSKNLELPPVSGEIIQTTKRYPVFLQRNNNKIKTLVGDTAS